jgi:sugar lactone lactonase YvrE
VALDGKGNVFVADQSNHVLRRITIAAGVVTTFAGQAAETGSEDGIGEKARLGGGSGMVSDGQGTLFAVVTDNHVIRQVVMATGQVTTFAGSSGWSGTSDGVAAAARFTRPAGITSDDQGNLYVTDSGNHVIRRIAVATAEVTTLVGAPGASGSADGVGENARFSSPQGIAADDAGNIFVSDAGTTIRKIVISTRTVTTLAGLAWAAGQEDGVGSQARFSFPRGLAWDAGSLFVADAGNYTIRRVSTADATVTTVAGSPGQVGNTDGTGLQARFSSLDYLAVDHFGHLFVSDESTIRKLTIHTGAVTTVVGSPDGFGIRLGPLPASLGVPSGLVFVEPGILFISDLGAILRAAL